LAVYEAEALEAFAALEDLIDAPSARAAWRRARASRWTGAPVWLHGDMAAGNLLLAEGRLVAVIDFGCCAVGDPACDLTIAWTLLDAAGAAAFRRGVDLDDGTWDRARGWALWKAAITLRRERGRRPDVAEQQRALIARILDEPPGATTPA
jgi:aminoglycoside phosphotransferase (APT) family kinase protein